MQRHSSRQSTASPKAVANADHEGFARRTGNHEPRLRLECGMEVTIDPRAPVYRCPQCV